MNSLANWLLFLIEYLLKLVMRRVICRDDNRNVNIHLRFVFFKVIIDNPLRV